MDSLFELHYFIAGAGIWTLGNGILHDLFVLREGRPFERELVRLLIDGHILIFSGIIYLLCYIGIRENQPLAFLVSIAIAIFLLGYCALIFKMLPSVGIILINTVLLVWLIISYLNVPSGTELLQNDHAMTKDRPLIVRISIGYFSPDILEEVTKKLKASEGKLRPAVENLNGNMGYYVAIDKEKNSMTNVSLWKTLKDAQQMSDLPEMQELRKEFEALNIDFTPITNHEILWQIK